MKAVEALNLEVTRGGITALLGANGSGKSSTLMCIAGLVEVQEGRIRLGEKDITHLPPMDRVKAGIALSPEGRRLFARLTVRENLIVGGYCRSSQKTASAIERVIAVFSRLGDRLDQLAGSLSGGEQQMLAIGRAMMAEPELLLIDELSLGLMPKAVDLCYEAIAALNRQGLTIILVEQSTSRALEAADQVCVLESGRTVWKGDAKQARSEADLIDIFLGLKK
jgi:branched-chain amino acid transport system ATP-binding protein